MQPNLIFVLPILLPCWPLAAAPQSQPGSAPRLGLAGGQAAKFETEVLAAINGLRSERRLPVLTLHESLRVLSRRQAELAARGDPQAAQIDEQLKAQGLAPHGYRLQYVPGTRAADILGVLRRDSVATEFLLLEFCRIGVGAFWVPDKPPYYQVAVLVARDLDPMAGRPGLSRDQTDPVMNVAGERIRTECYDSALRVDPNLRGNLIFQLVIGDKGQVDGLKLLSQTGHAALDECARSVVQGLTFPAPYRGKPVTLTHPLRLTPPQGDRRVGKLTPPQVAGVFNMAQGQIKECYDQRLQHVPRLHGELVVRMRVAPDGSLMDVSVEKDGLGDSELTACVLAQIRHLKFPRPEFGGEAEVSFPLRFDPPASPRKQR